VRFLGDIGLAEEAVQDAFTTALAHWPRSGVPPSPKRTDGNSGANGSTAR